jgi:arylsulfatase A-like enzyme
MADDTAHGRRRLIGAAAVRRRRNPGDPEQAGENDPGGVPGQGLPPLCPGSPSQELPAAPESAPGQDLPPGEDGAPDQGLVIPGIPDNELPDVGEPDDPDDDTEADLRRKLALHIAVHRRRHRRGKPNILVIFGDDVGVENISWYNRGLMGYRTPNIDRIANEGIGFTDAYADQSCTAGRSTFLLGQLTLRTGLTKVGFPGDAHGISAEDVTLASLLKDEGYATAQFGKNHLGDQDQHFPTMHGFDIFQGNLYHLNAEEEPENPDFPADPRYPRPRGVIHAERLPDGPHGARQRYEDTGPLTIERMPGIDDEFMAGATRWIRQAERSNTPWFCWFNTSRMHVWTRLKPESDGVTGLGTYPDGMVEHDGHVGQLLGLLDELGIAEDTIVIYSTDNGAEVFTWPDGGCTPFRGEKNSSWEGGYRVPLVMRWPGHFPAGTECSGIIALLDMIPTLMAAVGNDHVVADLAKGARVDGHRYGPLRLDGYNLLPQLTGDRRAGPWPRHEFIYITDGGEIAGMRWDQWKLLFLVSSGHGLGVWTDPFIVQRMPLLINLRSDPFEAGQYEGMGYPEWYIRRIFLLGGPVHIANALADSMEETPPRLSDLSLFTVDGQVSAVSEALAAVDQVGQLRGIARLLTSAPAD